jgi:hypothetical protein
MVSCNLSINKCIRHIPHPVYTGLICVLLCQFIVLVTIAPTELRTAVSARINVGHPLRKLQLSKSILAGLGDDLEWLQERVEVEEDTLYPDLRDDAYVVIWPGLHDDSDSDE